MINVNDYVSLTDSETFENALAHKEKDGIILIPPRVSEIEPERDYWLIDRAILLPENTTVIMQNSKIKLSDKCRDNFFRTANCGMGIEFPERIKNIHIKGEGLCILEGADHPRATGDGGKIIANPCPYEVEDLCRLADWIPPERRTPETIDFWDRHDHSFGTDAGKEGESQYGDWRGIGILFANVEDFSISNLRIVESHGWGISLEECAKGKIQKIDFDACMSKVIDQLRSNMENQDGIDLRNGCNNIIISDITGRTGDDVIALTAVANPKYKPGGSLCTTHVMHSDWAKRDTDIHDIIIRNVIAYSDLCASIRLLAAYSHIWNVTIDNVIDTSPDGDHWCTLTIGESDGGYGVNYPDSINNITVSNVICNANIGIQISGFLNNSIISNVINKRSDVPLFDIQRENGIKNVIFHNNLTSEEL